MLNDDDEGDVEHWGDGGRGDDDDNFDWQLEMIAVYLLYVCFLCHWTTSTRISLPVALI